MKKIDQQDLIDCLENIQKKGLHIDSRLINEVKKNGDYYLIELIDKESFLSLIWQEIDPTRLLTPKNEPRCLQDIAERFIKKGYTFKMLSNDLNLPDSQHDPSWFKKCEIIYESFQYDKFGMITVVPSNDDERKQSPNGTFYIYDGVHKSLVLAVKLLKKEITFTKIKSVLLIPRRS